MRKEKPFEKYWLIDYEKGIAVDVRPSDRVVVQFKSGHKLLFDQDLITILKRDNNMTDIEYARALNFVMEHLEEIQEKQIANGFKYYERLENRRKNVLSDRAYENIVWLQAKLLYEYSRRKGKSLKEALKDFNENQLIEYIYAYHEILSYCAMNDILKELMIFIEERGDESAWEHCFSWQY